MFRENRGSSRPGALRKGFSEPLGAKLASKRPPEASGIDFGTHFASFSLICGCCSLVLLRLFFGALSGCLCDAFYLKFLHLLAPRAKAGHAKSATHSNQFAVCQGALSRRRRQETKEIETTTAEIKAPKMEQLIQFLNSFVPQGHAAQMFPKCPP